MICDPCRVQQCEVCTNPLGCFCQHDAAATPVRALTGDERHAIVMGHASGGDLHPPKETA